MTATQLVWLNGLWDQSFPLTAKPLKSNGKKQNIYSDKRRFGRHMPLENLYIFRLQQRFTVGPDSLETFQENC